MCDCLNMVNKQLKESNTRVESTIAIQNGQLRFVGVKLSTTRLDGTKRGKAVMSVTAAFCPFCGEKYPTPTSEGGDQ